MKKLGRRYLEAALEHRNIGFSNLHQLITDIHEGHKKPCRAARAEDAGGRSQGRAEPVPPLYRLEPADLRQRAQRRETGGAQRLPVAAPGPYQHRLRRLPIRNLCSGGCYHESYARYGDPTHPTYHYCELMRDWVDFGIEVYTGSWPHNPAFISSYITPRKAH
jgi:uncharacterized protein